MGTHNRTHTTTTTQDLYKMATTQGQTTLGKEVAVHDIFQKTLDKTGHWLKDIKNECNLADVHQAYTLLRAVLFTIRDRAPMMDSIHFAAQLPMLVRGFFFEGWVPYDMPDKDIRTKRTSSILSRCTWATGQALSRRTSSARPWAYSKLSTSTSPAPR